MMPEPWTIRLFGALSASHAGITIERFRSRKTGVLLACLSLSPDTIRTREELVELLWPESTLENGQVSLRVALFSLRRLLESQKSTEPGTLLFSDRRVVGLKPDAFTTDVSQFCDALALAGEAEDRSSAFAHYTRAVDLYQGELLAGYYEDWILTERNRLAGAYIGALERLVRFHAEQENWDEAVEMAWRGIQADPLLESAYCDLMRLYIALKRPGEARAVYDLLARRLRESLGASPGRATRKLAESLVGTTAASAVLATSPDSPAFDTPQAKQSPSAPVMVEGTVRETPPYRIAASLSYFFGREEQIAQLTEMLLPSFEPSGSRERSAETSDSPALRRPYGGVRLVTLTGPGGAGKTRLALEVGAHLQTRFPGGAAFVSFAHLHDPRLLADELREALSAPRNNPEHPLDDVIAMLSRRPTLLILDNLEQIAETAALVVRDLLMRLPTQVCLTTSRRSLGLNGEREFPVASLPLPDLGATTTEMLGSASVQLFLDRARAVQPEFQITDDNRADIAALCQRLDGMPLALELAAARVRGLAPAQMLDLLSDRFQLLVDRRAGKDSRHRSLLATIEWSLQILPLEARRLFASLSVFRGGWTLEAAQSICLRTSDIVVTLDLLEQLRTDSMIRTQTQGATARFQMLESLREFGITQLTPAEREKVAWHHAEHFLRLVEGGLTEDNQPDPSRFFATLDQENDNLRAALHYLLSGEESRRILGARMAASLSTWWYDRAAFREGSEWIERALAAAPGNLPLQERARLLCAAGHLATGRGDNSGGQRLYRSGIEILQSLEEKTMLAGALSGLAVALQMLFQLEEAERMLLQSLALARETDNRYQVACILIELGGNLWNSGDPDGARTYYTEALQLATERGFKHLRARSLQNLALLECLSGNTTLARAYSDEGLPLAEELQSPIVVAFALLGRGLIECAELRFDLSHESLHRSLRILAERGERRILLLALHGMAKLATATGRHRRAIRLSASLRTLRKLFHPNLHREQEADRMLEAPLAPSRAALSEAECELAWQQGSFQTYEQILAYALSNAD
jgi:predicted ATPase/DNA-binding SARP family transcriptional activator